MACQKASLNDRIITTSSERELLNWFEMQARIVRDRRTQLGSQENRVAGA